MADKPTIYEALTAAMSDADARRFISKVQIDRVTNCWIWKGSTAGRMGH